MTILPDPQPQDDLWVITPSDFEKIAAFAKTHFGLALSEAKFSLVQSRLRKRMKVLGLVRFADYLACIEGPNTESERTELLSVLTTNVTHFFREQHHFDMLRDEVLDPLISAARRGGRVRLWSAGCSTGQEAYSIAMTLLDLCPEAARLDIKILATDIDPLVIEKAKKGTFTQAELAGIDPNFQQKFVRFEGNTDSGQMSARVKKLNTFKIFNLIDPLPFQGPFDAIFCRNVAIYFDRDTQMMLWQKLATVLAPVGYLFIGHSERLIGPVSPGFQKAGVTAYRRVTQ